MNYILVISNGYGEDLIASQLCQSILNNHPKCIILPIPLIGSGQAYQKIGLSPFIKNDMLPSGGFIRTLKELFLDIKAGLIKNHYKKHTQTIQLLKHKADTVISVGDIYALWMGSRGVNKPLFFLPTAKSDLFMPHSWFEKYLIKKWAKHVFPRDELTTKNLIKDGIKASFYGNPMMDRLVAKKIQFEITGDQKVIGILPGSRKEAIGNLERILSVVIYLQKINPKLEFIIALAPQINLDDVQFSGWQIKKRQDECYFSFNQSSLRVGISSEFIDVVQRSSCIIGMAGTANEQAVFMNRHVFTFEGTGPQSTKQRFLEQAKLCGDKCQFIAEKRPQKIASHIAVQLDKLPSNPNLPDVQVASDHIVNNILNQL